MKIYPTIPELNKETGLYEIRLKPEPQGFAASGTCSPGDKVKLEFATEAVAIEKFMELEEQKLCQIEEEYLSQPYS